MSRIQVRCVPRDQLLDLRHRVLRAGRPRETAYFPGDELPTTRHYAACDGDRVVGCASFMASELDGAPAWQLRAMATDDTVQGQGVGRALLERSARELSAASGVLQFWCNARTGARGFYEKLGWTVSSEEFDIEGVGPHFKMRWLCAALPR